MYFGLVPSSASPLSLSSQRHSPPQPSKRSKLPKPHPLLLSALTLLAVPSFSNAITLDCKDVSDDGQHWNLSKLKPTSVHLMESETFGMKNTTFTFDVCKTLKMGKGCPAGTRICAEEYHQKEKKSDDAGSVLADRWVIAGEDATGSGRHMDPQVKRLKNSGSNEDSDREGLRVFLGGGQRGKGKKAVEQRAIIEFLCDQDKTGNEKPNAAKNDISPTATGNDRVTTITTTFVGGPTPTKTTIATATKTMTKPDDGADSEPIPNPDKGQSLQLKKYALESNKDGDAMVLRLVWRTKFACEKGANNDPPNDDDNSSNGGWGFFTWFIIIFFLAVASYLIFGSWLNYNRYGARGWDLLPHGDTIRDVPYLLKDWARSIFSTLQGGGRRDLGYIRV